MPPHWRIGAAAAAAAVRRAIVINPLGHLSVGAPCHMRSHRAMPIEASTAAAPLRVVRCKAAASLTLEYHATPSSSVLTRAEHG